MSDFFGFISTFTIDAINSPIGGIVGCLFGYLIGNIITVGRDKRIEFNKIADPIRITLIRECERPSRMGIEDTDIIQIREFIPFWRIRGFDIAAENYKNRKKDNYKPTSTGCPVLIDENIVVQSAASLLKYVKRR